MGEVLSYSVKESANTEKDAVKKLWEFLQIRDELDRHPRGAVVLGCSQAQLLGEYTAWLYLQGYVSFAVFSGYKSGPTLDWPQTEAEVMMQAARKIAPNLQAELEVRSANLGDNLRYSAQLLHKKGLIEEEVVIISHPVVALRARQTALKQWPEPQPKRFYFTSYRLEFERQDYKSTIELVLGEIDRLLKYPRPCYGYIEPIEIPDEILKLYSDLRNNGFKPRCKAEAPYLNQSRPVW